MLIRRIRGITIMDSIFSIVFTMNMYLFVHKERGQCLVMCLAGTLNFSLFCATSKDGSLLFRDAHDLEFVSEIDVRKYPFRYHALDLIAENPDCLGLGTYLCSHGLSLLTTVGAEGQITIGPPPAVLQIICENACFVLWHGNGNRIFFLIDVLGRDDSFHDLRAHTSVAVDCDLTYLKGRRVKNRPHSPGALIC